jgi:hypothetical protein
MRTAIAILWSSLGSCALPLSAINSAYALSDADLATICAIAQHDPAFTAKLQKECSGVARAKQTPSSAASAGAQTKSIVARPQLAAPVVTKAASIGSNGPATGGASAQPNPYFVLLRSTWSDVGILANPIEAQKAAGATVAFTQNYVAANRNWTAQGVAAFGYSNIATFTPGVTGGWFDKTVAVYVQDNSNYNSNAKLTSKNSDTRTAGLAGELGYVDLSGNNYQFFRVTPSVTQDAIKGTTSVAVMGEYIPAFQGLWDNFGYFGGNINAQIDPDFKVQYASTTDPKNPLAFSGKSQSLRIGPEVTLIVQPYTAGTNPFLDRIALNVTYHPWYDSYANRAAYWWTNALVYNLTTDGNFAVSAKYNRGLDENSGEMTNQYIIGLSGKL